MWDLSSPTRNQTWVPFLGMQILYHWTTREVPTLLLLNKNKVHDKNRLKNIFWVNGLLLIWGSQKPLSFRCYRSKIYFRARLKKKKFTHQTWQNYFLGFLGSFWVRNLRKSLQDEERIVHTSASVSKTEMSSVSILWFIFKKVNQTLLYK